jgi:PAS domain S-box-containing protein
MRLQNATPVNDITIRRQTDEALHSGEGAEKVMREGEERFRKIFENAATGIAITDWQGRFQQCNPAYTALLGYSESELHQINFDSLIHPEDRETNLAHVRCLKAGEVPSFEIENRYVRRDGQPVWVRKFVSVLPDETGRPAHLLALVTDITERKRSVAALRESEEKLRLFIEHAPVAIAMFDREMRYLSVSRRWLVDYRPGDGDIIGRSHYEVFPEIPERWREAHERGLKGEVVRANEDFFPRVDATVHWLRWEVQPWKQADGTVGGIVIFVEDISARKRAEDALVKSETRMQAILNTATDAVITMEIHGIIQSVNPAAEKMFGYTAAEMVGQNMKMLMPSPYREEHDGYLANYRDTGEKRMIGTNREVDARHRDGRLFPVELAVSEVKDLGLFTGMVRDITRRKLLEREVVEVASLEQRRIGQDLHDTIGQELTALNLLAGNLTKLLPTDAAKASKVAAEIAGGLQRVQQELRAVQRGLLPVAVDSQGLMAALADLAERTCHERKVTCTFHCPIPVSLGDNLTATHLYLIAQEAVHNALKHSQAGQINIQLTWDTELVLSVQDDGIGMSAALAGNQGLGLRIMRNRAGVIGAKLTIETAEPNGTVVTCVLMLRNHEPKQEEDPIAGSDRR